MPDYHVVSVAGHKDHLGIGTRFGETLGEFASAHPGHHHVGEKQIDRRLERLGNRQGVVAMSRFEDRIAVIFELGTKQDAYALFVFDQQHGLMADGGGHGLRRTRAAGKSAAERHDRP